MCGFLFVKEFVQEIIGMSIGAVLLLREIMALYTLHNPLGYASSEGYEMFYDQVIHFNHKIY